MKSPVRQAPSGGAVFRGASVGQEGPVIKHPESAYVGTDSLGLSVRRRVPGSARHDAPVRMVASVRAKGSAPVPLDGRVQFARSDAQREGLGETVPRSVSATTEANVTPKPDCVSVLKVLLATGVMRSAPQALTVRTVKACATVPTVRAATTSMEPASASRASVGRTAGTGCVHPGNTACTANAHVSARTNTRSAATQ